MLRRQNYDAFFEAELPLRQLRGCPPYRDLLTVTFHGREEERVWQAALAFRARLDGLLHSEFYRGETAAVLGPAPASVARINYHYRCRLTLSCVNTRRLRELLAFLVREFAKDRSFRGRRRVCGCQRQRIKGNHDGTEEYFDRRGACAAQDGTARDAL